MLRIGQQGLGQVPGSWFPNADDLRPGQWHYNQQTHQYDCEARIPPTLWSAGRVIKRPSSACPPCPCAPGANATVGATSCACNTQCPSGYIPNSAFARESCNNLFVTSGNCIKCIPAPPSTQRLPSAPPTFTGRPLTREMSEVNQAAFAKQQAVGGLGQASSCPSPLWYLIGGAVAWAILGDVLKGAGRVAGRGAQYGLAKVEKKIPAREGGSKIEVDTITLPAYWASALINGDTSGMEDDEIAAMERELARLGDWQIVSTADDAEPYFSPGNTYVDGKRFHGDVLDYIAHRYR